MRRWRLRNDKGPTLAHCWLYPDQRGRDGTWAPGFPLCGVQSVPQQNWHDWQPGEAWCVGFCKRCAKVQEPPTAGQSGTTR